MDSTEALKSIAFRVGEMTRARVRMSHSGLEAVTHPGGGSGEGGRVDKGGTD